ncbi:hypothetical protein [Methylocystis parvus]|uniref:Uncharacterized protein n=1 Tax=Methylocystis parvus TaxID=134 RepID=A0A6B8LXR9_9HYPH|nr:hypothetical protein [Methylocystis parvus]QGM96244.1 hypothetical protein F7D14_01225 [Methylocystis parvus]WBJ99925.1 hypothetical protein MMG94_18385 [Methylocystis parvus OBBP]
MATNTSPAGKTPFGDRQPRKLLARFLATLGEADGRIATFPVSPLQAAGLVAIPGVGRGEVKLRTVATWWLHEPAWHCVYADFRRLTY